MRKPKLIFYNDARHYSMYRYDPPMSLHQLRQPVDELLGTGVDTLVIGLGSGQTFLHDSRTGLKWGEGVEVHNWSMMWWIASENLKLAIEAGHDPLSVVVDRAHEKGLQVLGSLRMNDPTAPEQENPYMLGRVKAEHPDVMIGEEDPNNPNAATSADFSREEVRQERLDVIEETCSRFDLDGLEMDPYVGAFFKPSEVRKHTPLMTEFVREVRRLLGRIDEKRGEATGLTAKVFPSEEANLAMGMDVRTWLAEGLVDLVVPVSNSFLLDQEMPIEWLVDAAGQAGTWIYPALGRVPYDDRHHLPTIEMYRAAAANYRAMGTHGLFLSDLPWPHTEREYQVLREMGDPDIHNRKNKHYFVVQKETLPGSYAPKRHLPIELEEGMPRQVPFIVGDDLDAARTDGELKAARLGVRILRCCPEDLLLFRFNGTVVSPKEITHIYGGVVAYTAHRGGLPERIDTHYWFEFDLPCELVREGRNEFEVVLEQRYAPLGKDRELQQVELNLDYREPAKPIGGQM